MLETKKENEIVRKKGRPRKEKTEELENDKPEKKKRGRKKKIVDETEIKPKKKRGRKAAVKYFSSSIRKKIPLTTKIQDNNNNILHLEVTDIEEQSTNEKMFINKTVDDKYNEVGIVDGIMKEEIQEMLDNDKSILSDYINNKDTNINLRELYEARIENREKQDKALVDKLEMIHKENVIDIFNENIEEETKLSDDMINKNKKDKDMNRKKGYFGLLYDFVIQDDWLENTNICCWWCCHKFETVPIGIPIQYIYSKKKFRVRGVFCSFSCMKAYVKNDNKHKYSEALMKYMYCRITGENLNSKIECAPPRESLCMFGGELTIDEFRRSTQESKIYRMIEYPMFACRDYVEEVDIANVKNVNNIFKSNVFNKIVNLDDKRVEDAKTRLSQIEKTTITGKNTIDQFIRFS
jgi:hypothetical protein